MGTVIVAIAGAVTGVAALVLYLVRRRDDPQRRYEAACEAVKAAEAAEKEALDAAKAELNRDRPDSEAVKRLADGVAAAARRLREAEAARDRLRP